ncbi:MAG: methyltransferase domain-containing protein [Planctomycetaceae bacterium]
MSQILSGLAACDVDRGNELEQKESNMSAQDRTLDRYQELMQINAASQILRSAREVGLFDELRRGQRTIDQLTEALGLGRETTELLVDCLVSMSVIERYAEDHALAPVMRLLCEHDTDLGDAGWARLSDKLQKQPVSIDDQSYLDAVAATQWIHTPAAMQAAEILDIGGETADAVGDNDAPLKILDLGCGSAVWSCALAYRDAAARVVAVDNPAALVAAEHTASSIELGKRFLAVPGDPETAELPNHEFDIALIAQRLHSASKESADRLLQQAVSALAPGGRLVIVDLFRGPAKPRLSETIEALRLHLATEHGRMKSISEAQAQLEQWGLHSIQFTFLAASRINLGLMVARKP